MTATRLLVASTLALMLASCSRPPEPLPPVAPAPALRVESLATPAGAGSAQPSLALDARGRALLSWLEPLPTGGKALRFATFEGDHWSPALSIVEGAGLLANWADTPSMAAAGGDRLAAVWPALQREGSEGYDVHVALSSDAGATWSEAITPHRDGTETEHDFASLVPGTDGSLGVLWLDGRANATTPPGAGAQALMAAFIASDGTLGPELTLDPRVCDCCATAAVATDGGIVAAYRDRSADEVRDIAVIRQRAATWGSGSVVHPDGWKIAGCPVNGPALAAAGDRVALAWFAEPESGARVSLAISTDGGSTFGAPLRIDEGRPLGRVDVTLLADDSALVGWIELDDEGASFRARRMPSMAGTTEALVIARVETGRAGGFPRLIRSGGSILAAWTAREGDSTRVLTARLR